MASPRWRWGAPRSTRTAWRPRCSAGTRPRSWCSRARRNPARPEYATRREVVDGIDTVRVNNLFRLTTSLEESYRNPPIRALGSALIDEVRPDVAHVHHLTCLSTDLVVELTRRRVPIVFTLHDFWMICHRGQLLDLDYRLCRGPYPFGCGRCVGTSQRVVGSEGAGAGHDNPLRLRACRALGDLARREAGRRQSWKRLRHMRAICRQVDQFLAPSRTMQQRFLEFGIPDDRMVRHDYGIDLARLADARPSPADRLRLGFLGSLMISKGAHVLLEAFAPLHPRASLHVYGDPVGYHGDDSYRHELAPLLAIPGVHHMGSIPHARVPDALRSIDVLVAPSIWLENSPLVIREALAAGIPVVTSDIGGMAELVRHGENGLLFAAGSVSGLRAALLRLLDEPALLPALRAGIGAVRGVDEDADATYRIYRSHIERSLASGRRGGAG